MFYVKIVINGVHSETFRFSDFMEARTYALVLHARRKGGAQIWLGQDGEGSVLIK